MVLRELIRTHLDLSLPLSEQEASARQRLQDQVIFIWFYIVFPPNERSPCNG